MGRDDDSGSKRPRSIDDLVTELAQQRARRVALPRHIRRENPITQPVWRQLELARMGPQRLDLQPARSVPVSGEQAPPLASQQGLSMRMSFPADPAGSQQAIGVKMIRLATGIIQLATESVQQQAVPKVPLGAQPIRGEQQPQEATPPAVAPLQQPAPVLIPKLAPLSGQLWVPSHVPIKLTCTLDGCEAEQDSKQALAAHTLESHRVERFICRVDGCHESRDHKDDFRTHIKDDHANVADGEWPCKCMGTFESYRALKHHHKLFHETGQFACPAEGCDFVTEYRFEIFDHRYLAHTKKGELVCTFKGCPTVCNTDEDMWQHALDRHLHELPFMCVYNDPCLTAFKDLAAIHVHLQEHIDKDGVNNPLKLDEYIRLLMKDGKLVQRTVD